MTFYEATYQELLKFLCGETNPSPIELKHCLRELLGHGPSRLLQNSHDVSLSDPI